MKRVRSHDSRQTKDQTGAVFGSPSGGRVSGGGDAEVAGLIPGDRLIQYISSNLQRGPSQDMTTLWRRSWPIKTSTPAEAGVVSMASKLNHWACCHHWARCGSGSKL